MTEAPTPPVTTCSPFASSPRDWTEDSEHENGSYLCYCITCKLPFVGYKRRHICKVCHTEDAAEAKRRAEWLSSHGAPADWVAFTITETRAMAVEMTDLFCQLHAERKARHNLAVAVEAVRKGAPHAGKDLNRAVYASNTLDADIAARSNRGERTSASARTKTDE